MTRLRFLSQSPWGFRSLLGRAKRRTPGRNHSLVPATLAGLHSGMLQAGPSPALGRICLPFTLIPPRHSNGSRIQNKALTSKSRAWHERRAANGAPGINPSPPPSLQEGREIRGAVKQRCNSSTCFQTPIFKADTPSSSPAPSRVGVYQPARGMSHTKNREKQTMSTVRTPPPSPVRDSVVLVTPFAAPWRDKHVTWGCFRCRKGSSSLNSRQTFPKSP